MPIGQVGAVGRPAMGPIRTEEEEEDSGRPQHQRLRRYQRQTMPSIPRQDNEDNLL